MTILPWDPTRDHYEGGEEVWDQGGLFQANYWTQADPLAGTADWTTLQPTINTPEAPDAPTGLHSTFTSSSIVNLGWDPAVVPGIGTVTQYDVFENGTKIGSTTSTSYHVAGLTGSTSYQFTVDAVDTTGTGPQTAPFSVTTSAPIITSGQYYSPYVDVTIAPPSNNPVVLSTASGITSFTLAFIQSSGVDSTTHIPMLGWGGSSFVPITNDGGITAEVQALQAKGGTITIAFGGAAGTDPAVAADTYESYLINTLHQSTATAFNNAAAMLQAQFQSVIDHYGVSNLDFDIEGATAVNDVNGDHLRNIAIKNLETANSNLKVSFTLPTLTTGLDPNAGDFNGDVKSLLTYAAQDGVRIDVINIMAMDYFDGVSGSMAIKAENAANAVHQQVIDAGFLSTKIGITPMVGVNDDTSEVFSIADAQTLESWAALPAQQSWVAGFGIWSMARDHGVPADPSNPSMPLHPEAAPQPTDSGVVQTDHQFSDILNQITAGTPAPPTGQTFIGTSANQTFAGTAAGNDTVDYFQHATGGVTVDLNITTAQIPGGGMGTDTLTSIENLLGSAFSDHLNGNSAVNMLTGNAGDDFLNGRGGADILTGGAGNDTYYVNDIHDQVIEGAGDASDKVYVVATSYTLDPNAQVEYLYADDGATGVTLIGNSFSHHVIGSKGIDHLTGGSGDDLLNGNAGADFMTGNGGNDSYYVDNASDHIIEGAGDSADKAYILTTSYTLDANAQVEYLYADDGNLGVSIVGNSFSHHLVGGKGVDHLTGGDGADLLNGNAGADFMTGGNGNDSYYVDNSSDHITEVAGGGTADSAYISASSYTLDANAQVEYLFANVGTGVTINGNSFSTHITGGAGADHLTGGSGADVIKGGGGNDTITGGAGGDVLTGGAGNDHFVFKSIADSAKAAGQYDSITDFTQGAGATGDKIDLSAIDASTAAGTQSFHWVGSGTFVAAGDLRAVVNANGTTTITADVDGNHTADFQIVLLTPVTLTANDFLGVHV